jgi:hypothetical protein
MKTDPYLPREEEGPALLTKICAIHCMASSTIESEASSLPAPQRQGVA